MPVNFNSSAGNPEWIHILTGQTHKNIHNAYTGHRGHSRDDIAKTIAIRLALGGEGRSAVEDLYKALKEEGMNRAFALTVAANVMALGRVGRKATIIHI